MNALTDSFPTELIISDIPCEIRCDFKTWIKFAGIMNGNLPYNDKVIKIFRLVFYQTPPSFKEALIAVKDFYCMNKKKKGENQTGKGKRIYDFEYDSELIYSAFFSQYGIDLHESNMHWYKFRILFDNLNDTTKFIKVLQYRSMDISKIKDKEQKKFYLEMKKLYKLPDNRTERQKEEDFISNFVDKFI